MQIASASLSGTLRGVHQDLFHRRGSDWSLQPFPSGVKSWRPVKQAPVMALLPWRPAAAMARSRREEPSREVGLSTEQHFLLHCPSVQAVQEGTLHPAASSHEGATQCAAEPSFHTAWVSKLWRKGALHWAVFLQGEIIWHGAASVLADHHLAHSAGWHQARGRVAPWDAPPRPMP